MSCCHRLPTGPVFVLIADCSTFLETQSVHQITCFCCILKYPHKDRVKHYVHITDSGQWQSLARWQPAPPSECRDPFLHRSTYWFRFRSSSCVQRLYYEVLTDWPEPASGSETTSFKEISVKLWWQKCLWWSCGIVECLVSLVSCFSTIRISECNTAPQQNLQCPVKFKPFVEGKFDRGEHSTA